MRPLRIPHLTGALFTIAACALSACSGGTSSGSFIANASPSPSASQSALATSTTITSSSTATVVLPAIGTQGIDVAGDLPAANAVASITETIGAAPPGGAVVFAKRRETSSSANPSPIVYVSFSSTKAVTLSAVPALMFTLPSVTAGAYYYLALDTGSGWQTPVSGPATVIGNTVTFVYAPGSIAIAPAQAAVFALYETSTAPPLHTSPNVLTFNAGSALPQTFTVWENAYAGAFTAKANCTAIPAPSSPPPSDPFVAQVSPSTATPTAAGGAVSFTVTAGAETGSCAITIGDVNSTAATVSVSVVLDQVIIYGHKHQQEAAR